MARAIVEKIEQDPGRLGFDQARATCARWRTSVPSPGVEEWWQLLQLPWDRVRSILLDPDEEGCRLRQNDPFVGILTRQERWAIYRECSDAPTV